MSSAFANMFNKGQTIWLLRGGGGEWKILKKILYALEKRKRIVQGLTDKKYRAKIARKSAAL